MQVTALTNGMFEVASQRDETVSYIVDPKTVSCSCPDFRSRRCQKELGDPQRRCKHLKACYDLEANQPQPTKLEKAAETARQLSDLELSRLAKKHLGGVPGAACLLEMARRVNALQERDPMQADALRSGRIIDAAEWLRQDAIEAGCAAAPRPIPAGVLELLQGATEAERERALSIYS